MPDTPVGTDSPDYGPLTSADLGADIYCKITATNASGTANADSNTVGPVTAASGGAYAGPGDVVASATAYWGLRAYNAAYAAPGTNPGIDIRDDADTTTTTLNILANGSLDVASVPGSGGPFRVSKMYDQVSANHLVQAVHANRPTLVLNAVGTHPAIQGAGLRGFGTTSNITLAQPYTWVFFFKAIANSLGQIVTSGQDGGLVAVDYAGAIPGDPLPTAIVTTGAIYATPNPASNVWHTGQGVFNGTSSVLGVDGGSTTGDVGPGVYSGVYQTFVFWNGTADGINGSATEFGFWPLAFSGANISAMHSNQAAWWV